MSDRPEKRSELFLQVQDDAEVPCRRCHRPVNFGKSCILARHPTGRLEVLQCHECLMELPPVLPIPGSRWRYTDPLSPTDYLDFKFLRFVGEGLVFLGPHGEWFCSREDWSTHLATFRVRPFVAPPERASA